MILTHRQNLIGSLALLVMLMACSSAAQPTSTSTLVQIPTPPLPLPTSPLPTQVSDPSTSPLATLPSTMGGAPVYTYRIINEYPHDPNAWTQGLIYQDGILFEGTGLNGRSSLRKVELATGNVLLNYALSEEYFGEGITILGNRLYQLTWQSHVGFIYDKDSFEFQETFQYPTEGWGITHDDERLIMSVGTPTLYFLDPTTLEAIDQVDVFDDNGPVSLLNELEYIDGEVYANVWKTNFIARIDPSSGHVLGWIDLTNILDIADLTQPADVLNGIAYDAENDRLFVTGKFWPRLFEIELIPIE